MATTMHKTVEFSREELFDKVWQTPVLKAAQEIGVSDVALAKACRKAGIPLPGRGHWAKKERARSKRPHLPKITTHANGIIQFTVFDPTLAPRRPVKPKAPSVDVPDVLIAPHALVQATLKAASNTDAVEGRVRLDRKRTLNIRVSPLLLDRAVRIFDALIKASEQMGCVWKITSEGTTIVTTNSRSIKVELKERLSKRELPPPPPVLPDRKRKGIWGPSYSAILSTPVYEWISTGQLTFLLDENLDGSTRKTWNDTANTKLEDKLGDILVTFPVAAAVLDRLDEERAEWRRKFEIEERQLVEEARLVEEQRRLRKKLVSAMQSWERATRIRAFCAAVAADVVEGTAEHQMAVPWIAWALEQAKGLDPLCSDLSDLLRLRAPVEEWFTGDQAYSGNGVDWWGERR